MANQSPQDEKPPTVRIEQVPQGTVAGLISAVKGLTFANALVVVILVAAGIPAYVLYRVINDTALLDRFLGDYREISAQNVGCTIRMAKVRGGAEMWAVTTGFAYQGADRWVVGVVLDKEPRQDLMESYCEALKLIVDYMRDPDNGESPSFPNSREPIVKPYRK